MMKRLAFFIAVIIGLNATSVARRPEEEEGQAVLQDDNHPSARKYYTSIIQIVTQSLNYYFYLITKEGVFHQISWGRIAEIIHKQQEKSKVTSIVYQYEKKGNFENTEFQIFR